MAGDPGTFLYDGECGFCSTSARMLVRWVPSEAVVIPWQRADLDALGLTAAECDESVQWVRGPRHTSGPAAIADLMSTSHRLWQVLAAPLGSGPGLAVARPVYGWISAHRHQLPGGAPACRG